MFPEVFALVAVLYMLWRIEQRLPAGKKTKRKAWWKWRPRKLPLRERNTIKECGIIVAALTPMTIVQLVFGPWVSLVTFVLCHLTLAYTKLAQEHLVLTADHEETQRFNDNLRATAIDYGTRLKKMEESNVRH